MSRLGRDASTRLERTAVRNFGLASRTRGCGTTEPSVEVKNHDTAILAVAGAVLIGLALGIYALAFAFGVEREISGSLSFLP
jgi:hypothetical protein